jgi:hypothetical protein
MTLFKKTDGRVEAVLIFVQWGSTPTVVVPAKRATRARAGIHQPCAKDVMSDQFHIYILTNRRHGTLCIGVTNDLVRRTYEHNSKSVKGFAMRYDLTRLVDFEALTARKLRSPAKNNSRYGAVTGRSRSSRRTTSIGTTCLNQSPTHNHRADGSRLALRLAGTTAAGAETHRTKIKPDSSVTSTTMTSEYFESLAQYKLNQPS